MQSGRQCQGVGGVSVGLSVLDASWHVGQRDWEDKVHHGALLVFLPFLAGVLFLVRVFAVGRADRVELGVDLQPIGIAADIVQRRPISLCIDKLFDPPRHLLLHLPLPVPCALLALLRLRTRHVRVE